MLYHTTNDHSYMEAVKVLYRSNVFDFDSLESLIAFSCKIPPQRCDSIHDIQLDFQFNLAAYSSESTPTSDSARWIRMWQIIGSIKSLQHLWVRISWPYEKIGARAEKRILEQLWMVDGLKTYDVSLPPVCGVEADWSDAPFKVIRRHR
jgi:hypothetical protein